MHDNHSQPPRSPADLRTTTGRSAEERRKLRADRVDYVLANLKATDQELADAMLEAGLFSKKTVPRDRRHHVSRIRAKLG